MEIFGYDDSDQCILRIFNISGQQILSTNAVSSKTELDISPHADGLYIAYFTNNQETIRFAEHLRSGTNRASLKFHLFDNTGNLSLIEARIQEQIKINQFKMIKDGGTLFNLRNEISPKYWKKFGIM